METPEIKLLSKYCIERVLGKGSFGHVLLGIEKSSGERVALKICSDTTESAKERFRMEIAVCSMIESPYFPEFYYYESCGTALLLAFEYCDGCSLQEYIAKNRNLDDEAIISIASQLVEALAYLHSRMIVHRDLKLENVIVTDCLKVKLCDFGLSTFFSKNERLDEFCGSEHYISPEILAGREYDGPANDVWTLGICILKMCIGLDAFEEVYEGGEIRAFYKIFECSVKNGKLKTVLRKALVGEENRASLEEIGKILGTEAEGARKKIRYIDPVIVERMKELRLLRGNGIEKILNVDFPEHHIYGMLFNRTYKKRGDKSLEVRNEIECLIKKSMKTGMEYFGCRRRTCVEIYACEDMVAEEVRLSSETRIREYPRGAVAELMEDGLVVEIACRKNGGTHSRISISLLNGEADRFVRFVAKILKKLGSRVAS